MSTQKKKPQPKTEIDGVAPPQYIQSSYGGAVTASGGYYVGTPIGVNPTYPNTTPVSDPRITDLAAKTATNETRQNMAQEDIELLKKKNAEQEELINILTEGLTAIREEVSGISEGVQRIVGERDYWKEIAQNLEVQRQAFLDEEAENQKVDPR